jgi:hypothetical protein
MKTLEASVYEFNPEVSTESRKLFVRFRLFSMAVLLLAILAAVPLAR